MKIAVGCDPNAREMKLEIVDELQNLGFELRCGDKTRRNDIIARLVEIQFERNDTELAPGRFRVRGDTIEIIPGYFNDIIRVELFGDTIERISEIEKTSGRRLSTMEYFHIYPARHFVTPEDERKRAVISIRTELEEVLPTLGMIEAHRLRQRTLFDIEMIEETGSCKGIENYS
ncbi:hypothetical protein EOM86_14830, partial [Candidatus Nomurabacteria bacterium]|nr:hypothetical protein [Candidatus Nomurabacteria bacterium]